MFNINTHPEFTRPVKIRTPEGDGFREDTITGRFVSLSDDDLLSSTR